MYCASLPLQMEKHSSSGTRLSGNVLLCIFFTNKTCLEVDGVQHYTITAPKAHIYDVFLALKPAYNRSPTNAFSMRGALLLANTQTLRA